MGKPTAEPTAEKRARIDAQWAAMKRREAASSNAAAAYWERRGYPEGIPTG